MISILVVDDKPKDLSLTGDLLKDKKHEIILIKNGKLACKFLQKKLPDIILLSIHMSKMTGLEVCKQIKQKKELKDIPIIFLTEENQKEDNIKGLELGAVDYLTKPLNKEELFHKIRNHSQIYKLLKKQKEEFALLNKDFISLKAELLSSKDSIKETEESYISLFRNTQTIMLLIDPKSGDIIDANRAAIDFYGYSYKQIHQMNINQINTLSAGDIKKEMKHAQNGESNLFYFKHKLADSKVRDVEVYSSKIILNNKSILLSIIHDVTDRKKAEQKLIKNESLLKKISDNYPHSYISIVEKDFTVSYAGGKEFQSINLDPKNYIGLSLDQIFKESAAFIKSKYQKAFKGEVCTFELFLFDQYQLYQAIPLYEGKEINRILIVVENITERKKSEIELLEAKQEAEEANLAKSRFLSNMSHELRTPLNSILGYNQLLKSDSNITSEQKDQINVVLRSGQHLLALINDILDYSKIEAGKLELISTDFNLSDLIKEVINITKINADGKNLYFYYKTVGTIPEIVNGDNRKMKQVLLNLLSNAVKFTNKGGVNFTVSCVGKKKNAILFKVEDSGVGISDKEMESIFEPFNQLGRKYNSGTGLGLVITKKLTELMKGNLSISSSLEKGSCFTVEIPLKAKSKVSTHIEKNQISDRRLVENKQLAIKIPNNEILEEILIETKKGDYNKLDAIINKLKKEDDEYIFFCDKIKNFQKIYNESAITEYIQILKSNIN